MYLLYGARLSKRIEFKVVTAASNVISTDIQCTCVPKPSTKACNGTITMCNEPVLRTKFNSLVRAKICPWDFIVPSLLPTPSMWWTVTRWLVYLPLDSPWQATPLNSLGRNTFWRSVDWNGMGTTLSELLLKRGNINS